MTALPPSAVFEVGDGYLLVGPAMSGYLARAIVLVEREHRACGIVAPPAWVGLREAVFRSAASARGTAEVRKLAAMSESESIGSGLRVGVGRVAAAAGVTTRWARELCRRGVFATARRIGRDWMVDEDELVAWVLTRGDRDEAAA